jgi:hypothetical protein
MVKAINHYKIAQQQQIEIKARIIKLRKEEEKATKRIKDTMHKSDFIEKMHKFKFDKIQLKKQYFSQVKTVEELNRQNFN